MKKLSCVIVEDDVISLKVVEALAEKTGMLEVKNMFTSPGQAIPWLMENEVDLLFLDIEMPDMTGLEMLRVLTYKPEVIIVSGNPSYAIEAFDLTIADYLLKPLKDYSRFVTAVNKVVAKKRTTLPNSKRNQLFVKIDSVLLNIDVDSIILIEAFGDYIKIHTAEKVHAVYSTLKKMEDKLDSKNFVRIHRSYIVSLSKITNINANNLEINKKIIPISGSYRDDLLNKISVL